MEAKKCSKCGEIKPVKDFYKSKNFQDGYRNQCKKCFRKNYTEYKYICNCGRKTNNKNMICSVCNKKIQLKTVYPCIECGKLIWRENCLCAKCEQKKPKYTELKCDWCKEIKNEKCFSHGSKSTYQNGNKKIYCIECRIINKKEINHQEWKDKQIKIFDLRKKNMLEFKNYLLHSTNDMLDFIKKIDYESYELALSLKKEAAINKDKKQNEKRKLRRLTDYEYNERQKNISRERYNSKYIRITLEDGVRRCINVEKCSEEMKDAVQGLIDLRKKNNFIKETKNVKIKG